MKMGQQILFEKTEVEIVKNKDKKKAIIEISLCEYDNNSEENLKNLREKNIPCPKIKGFAVDFLGHNEGSGSPCKDEEEVKKQVEYLKKKHSGMYKLEIIDDRLTELKDSDWNEINELVKRCKDKEYAYLFVGYSANPTLESKNESIDITSTHEKPKGEMGSSYGSWGWENLKNDKPTTEKFMEELLDDVRSKVKLPYHPTIDGIFSTTLKRENILISFSKKAREYLEKKGFDFKKFEDELKKIKQTQATKEDVKKSTTFDLMEKQVDKLKNECWAIKGYFEECYFLPQAHRRFSNYHKDKLKELNIDTTDLNKLRDLYIKKANTYKIFYAKVYMQRHNEMPNDCNP